MPGTTGEISNCMIGFPNRIDSATLSGGSWASSLPLTNLKVRDQGDVAVSSNLLAASTQFTGDLGAQYNIRLFAVANHNFSLTAQYRLRTYLDAALTQLVTDSGLTDVWPVVYPFGTLPWESPNWWGGKYSAEEISGYNKTLVIILPYNAIIRYWKFEIIDTSNSDGYVQMGRVFIGPAWQPQINMSWGESLSWETKTEVQEMLSGAEAYRVRTPYRVERYKLEALTRDEAMANVFEIQRRAGIDKEILWINNPSDTAHAIRTQFLGRLRVLNPIEYPYNATNSVAMEIKELL